MRKGAPILDRFKKKNLDFVFFPLGLSNFWGGAWFPFDEGQFNLGAITLRTLRVFIKKMSLKGAIQN